MCGSTAPRFKPPLAPSSKAVEPNVMPKGAKWIWSEPGADKKALAEWVYFRKTFTLAAVPEEAVAVVACDNSFILYVNGTKVTSGKDFGQPNLGLIKPHLRKGRERHRDRWGELHPRLKSAA